MLSTPADGNKPADNCLPGQSNNSASESSSETGRTSSIIKRQIKVSSSKLVNFYLTAQSISGPK